MQKDEYKEIIGNEIQIMQYNNWSTQLLVQISLTEFVGTPYKIGHPTQQKRGSKYSWIIAESTKRNAPPDNFFFKREEHEQ